MTTDTQTKLHSTLAGDEDFADLLVEFVAGLQVRQQALRECLSNNDIEKLTRIVHQLKGACGGYGFACLTNAARDLEEQLRGGESINGIRKELEKFIDSLSLTTAEPI